MILHRSSTFRGITLGLWSLTGLALLTDTLLPGIGRFPALAPWLLAVSVGWTALVPLRDKPSVSRPPRMLLSAGLALALATSFTIIHDGDRRSLLLVGIVGLTVLLLSAGLLTRDILSRAGSDTRHD